MEHETHIRNRTTEEENKLYFVTDHLLDEVATLKMMYVTSTRKLCRSVQDFCEQKVTAILVHILLLLLSRLSRVRLCATP